MYIKHSNVYVVSTSRKNANVSLVFVFLHRLVQVRGLDATVCDFVGGPFLSHCMRQSQVFLIMKF